MFKDPKVTLGLPVIVGLVIVELVVIGVTAPIIVWEVVVDADNGVIVGHVNVIISPEVTVPVAVGLSFGSCCCSGLLIVDLPILKGDLVEVVEESVNSRLTASCWWSDNE